MNMRRLLGFSLVELIIVIVVGGILAAVIAPIVMKPFRNYNDTSRRVALVDAAESAMRKISSEVRDAIPNTLRASGGFIEFMPIRGGGRYRISDMAADNNALTPSATDSQFQMLGNMSSMPSGARIVVYNTGATQFYAAATNGGLGVITPISTTTSLTDNGNEDIISLSSGFRFDLNGTGSPGKRFFVATSPVTYACDIGTGNLHRYEGYATTVAQPTNEFAAPLNGASSIALVSDKVTTCNFSYVQGTSSRAALFTMTMTLSIDGELINILHQVHVRNVP